MGKQCQESAVGGKTAANRKLQLPSQNRGSIAKITAAMSVLLESQTLIGNEAKTPH